MCHIILSKATWPLASKTGSTCMKHTHNKQGKQAQHHVGANPEYALNRSIPNASYIPAGTVPRRKGSIGPTSNPGQTHPAVFNKPLKEKKHHSWKKIIGRSFLTILILAILAVGYVGWKFITNEMKVFGWSGYLEPAGSRPPKESGWPGKHHTCG